MSADDKYPESTGRRRFVKGVVGAAGLAGVGTTAATALDTTTAPSGSGGGTTQYYGIENTAGPAPRSMPQIPIEIDDEGYLMGLWPEPQTREDQGVSYQISETELGGITYSNEWFQYCGIQTSPGVVPDADQDNYFRYSASPPQAYEWQNEDVEGGDRVHIDDFSDYQEWGNEIGRDGLGKPAMATWRSEDVSASEGQMPVQIIRSPLIEEQAQNNEWLNASTQDGFFAWLDKCTHFCCVPAYKAYEGSQQFGAADQVYCQCHQSVYDPFSIVQETFVALPRPNDGGD